MVERPEPVFIGKDDIFTDPRSPFYEESPPRRVEIKWDGFVVGHGEIVDGQVVNATITDPEMAHWLGADLGPISIKDKGTIED